MIDTNVKGLLYVSQIVARKMIAAGGGHIVNIGSIAGTEPYENGAVDVYKRQDGFGTDTRSGVSKD